MPNKTLFFTKSQIKRIHKLLLISKKQLYDPFKFTYFYHTFLNFVRFLRTTNGDFKIFVFLLDKTIPIKIDKETSKN